MPVRAAKKQDLNQDVEALFDEIEGGGEKAVVGDSIADLVHIIETPQLETTTPP